MKRLSITQTLVFALALTALPASTAIAVTESPNPAGGQHLTNLQSRGTSEINRRVSNLQAALTKLSASTKLSAADKDALTTQINLEVSGLNTLKAKLAKDTTLVDARADVASIVSDYRVYALMLPKARMASSADRFGVAEDKLKALHDKLVNEVRGSNGSADTAKDLQVRLAHMQQQIDAAKTATNGLVTQLLALKPTDYNANHAVLVDYRDKMKSAQEDLKSARDDAQSVVQTLKQGK
jgi:hypothetical protein